MKNLIAGGIWIIFAFIALYSQKDIGVSTGIICSQIWIAQFSNEGE